MLSDYPMYATLPASDVDRARRFYAETLGLGEPQEQMDGLMFDAGKGTRLYVYPSTFAGTAQNTAISWDVADLDAEMAELRARGVAFEDYDMPGLKTENGVATLPDGGRACWFKDTEGNIVALGEYRVG